MKMAEKWSSWMANLPSNLWDYPLCSLAIPGSHNSLSFYTDKEANIDRKIEPIFRQFVDHFGELAAELSYRWTKTQSLTVTQQLDIGVRYFDIRVTARSGDDKNVFFRNGPNILQILKEFRRWSDQHPQEVIILDFRVVNRFSAAQHRYLLANMTQDVFENKMLECTGHVKGVTLRNMWAVGAQLIVFYPKECVFDYKSVWPNDYLTYIITESQSVKEMVESLDRTFSQERLEHLFYCWNGVMTPNNEFLAANLHKTLEDKMSKPALRAIINWVRNKDINYNDINIVVADFVHLYDFCKEIIQVNYGVRKLKRYEFESRTCSIL